jgi:hypothetical protein
VAGGGEVLAWVASAAAGGGVGDEGAGDDDGLSSVTGSIGGEGCGRWGGLW